MGGKVILVGAGPGDPELLTIKGKKAIKSADVVVTDRLVSSDILNMIPENAEIIDVGKKASFHSVPQKEINQILIDKALEDKRVVRLKGGDPFLFGRGGEELEALCEYGIDFEVIPGISSALSVPAYGGIPVTHRDFCSSVHMITGHAKAGKELDINFEALVRSKGTLVFLMGLSSLPLICNGLLTEGLDPHTPAATIEQGTTPHQRNIIATVGTLAESVKNAKVKSPAITVVGQVCKLAEKFDWFSRLPLKGKSIVVTRPKERNGTLSERLRELGADVLEYPCIETVPIVPCPSLEDGLCKISKYEWLVFTSPAGVNVVMEYLDKVNRDVRIFAGIKIAVIGGGTGAELKKYGLKADLMPENYSAEDLGKKIAELARGKILITRAEIGSPDLTKELDAANLYYDDIAVYRTVYQNKHSKELDEDVIDFVTFTSMSTVKGFVTSVGENFDFGKVVGFCIGQQTASEAMRYGIKTITAKNATIPDLIDTVLEEVGK